MEQKFNWWSIAGFAASLFSVIVWNTLGIAAAIGGIVCSMLGREQAIKKGQKTWMAKVGLVVGIVRIAISAIILIVSLAALIIAFTTTV